MSQYLKPDSELGFIEDSAEIEYSKFNNLRHVVLGCMLGDFDETGAYVVAPEIATELIEMKKYIADTYDNIEICRSELKLDKQITFMVTFEGNKATLSLLEKLSYEANFKINSGTYSNINEYILDQIETTGEINRNVVYQRWNIDVYGGEVIDVFNCDASVLEKYFGIVNRFKYLLEANKTFLEKEEEIEEIEAGYANEMFDALKRYPKLNEAVMNQIKETLNEKKNSLSVTKPNFAKTFNEILDNAIKSNIDTLDEKEKENFEIDKRNVVLNANIKKAEVIEINHVKIEDDKNELSPNVLKLKTNTTYSSKSVQELGEEFVSAHQKVSNRIKTIDIKTPIGKTENPESEKNKLVATLVGAGLGAVMGGIAGAVVGAVAGAVTADVAEKVAETVEKTAQAKKPENKKAEAKKPAAKKAEAKKPAAKKAEVNKPAAKKPEVKKPQQQQTKPAKGQSGRVSGGSGRESSNNNVTQDNNEALAETYANRLLSQMVGNKEENKAARKKKPQEKQKDVVAQTLTAEEMIKMEEVIAKQAMKNKRAAELAAQKTKEDSILNQELKRKRTRTTAVVEESAITETTVLSDLF